MDWPYIFPVLLGFMLQTSHKSSCSHHVEIYVHQQGPMTTQNQNCHTCQKLGPLELCISRKGVGEESPKGWQHMAVPIGSPCLEMEGLFTAWMDFGFSSCSAYLEATLKISKMHGFGGQPSSHEYSYPGLIPSTPLSFTSLAIQKLQHGWGIGTVVYHI